MNVQSDIMSGMDPKEIGDTVQALTNSFKQADVSSGFISRASAGQEGALLFLTTQQEAFGTAAEGMAAQEITYKLSQLVMVLKIHWTL